MHSVPVQEGWGVTVKKITASGKVPLAGNESQVPLAIKRTEHGKLEIGAKL